MVKAVFIGKDLISTTGEKGVQGVNQPKYLEEVTIYDWHKRVNGVFFELLEYPNAGIFKHTLFTAPNSSQLAELLTNDLLKDIDAEIQAINKK